MSKSVKPINPYVDRNAIYPLALQGNIKDVLDSLERTPDLSLTIDQLDLKRKYQKRFVSNIEEKSSVTGFAGEVLQAHEIYWRKVLRHEISADEGYRFWFDTISVIAKKRGKRFGHFGDQEAYKLSNFIGEELKKEGFYSQLGRTKPHMDLLLWKKQSTESYNIDLGDTSVVVPVVMMDGFVTLGWLGFATFDYKYTGGWAENDKLYCVKPAYDLNSERFRISYLAHEGRHFSDYKRFPKLESNDLEYRAKLTELVLADLTLKKLLNRFLEEGNGGRSGSHSIASHQIIKNMTNKLGLNLTSDSIQKIDMNVIKNAAKLLLAEHTNSLEILGASSVKGVYSEL